MKKLRSDGNDWKNGKTNGDGLLGEFRLSGLFFHQPWSQQKEQKR